MIPKVINFIFGLRKDFCGKPFSYFHHLNIYSAKKVNPEYDVNVYYYYKPESKWFDALYNFCNVIKLEEPPAKINNKDVKWGEHVCGYLRLKKLQEHGGIYLDTDVVCIKPFDDLLNSKCVMGFEVGCHETIGLADAVILSEKNSEFIQKWINNYDTNYADDHWNMDAVVYPYLLSMQYPELIRTVSPDSFFKHSWDYEGTNRLFNYIAPIKHAYCLHLWESRPDQYNLLCKYDVDYILSTKNTLSYVYRKVIWDDETVTFPEPGNVIIP